MERLEYNARLAKVKTLLPKQYGVILKHRKPKITTTKVYNVVDKGAYNEEVLLALEEEFLTANSI